MVFEINFIENKAPLAFVEGLNLPGVFKLMADRADREMEFSRRMSSIQFQQDLKNKQPNAQLKIIAERARFQDEIAKRELAGQERFDAQKLTADRIRWSNRALSVTNRKQLDQFLTDYQASVSEDVQNGEYASITSANEALQQGKGFEAAILKRLKDDDTQTKSFADNTRSFIKGVSAAQRKSVDKTASKFIFVGKNTDATIQKVQENFINAAQGQILTGDKDKSAEQKMEELTIIRENFIEKLRAGKITQQEIFANMGVAAMQLGHASNFLLRKGTNLKDIKTIREKQQEIISLGLPEAEENKRLADVFKEFGIQIDPKLVDYFKWHMTGEFGKDASDSFLRRENALNNQKKALEKAFENGLEGGPKKQADKPIEVPVDKRFQTQISAFQGLVREGANVTQSQRVAVIADAEKLLKQTNARDNPAAHATLTLQIEKQRKILRMSGFQDQPKKIEPVRTEQEAVNEKANDEVKAEVQRRTPEQVEGDRRNTETFNKFSKVIGTINPPTGNEFVSGRPNLVVVTKAKASETGGLPGFFVNVDIIDPDTGVKRSAGGNFTTLESALKNIKALQAIDPNLTETRIRNIFGAS